MRPRSLFIFTAPAFLEPCRSVLSIAVLFGVSAAATAARAEVKTFPVAISSICDSSYETDAWRITNLTSSSRVVELITADLRRSITLKPSSSQQITTAHFIGKATRSFRIRVKQRGGWIFTVSKKRIRTGCPAPTVAAVPSIKNTSSPVVQPTSTSPSKPSPSPASIIVTIQPTATPLGTVSPTATAKLTATETPIPTIVAPATPTSVGQTRTAPILLDGRSIDPALMVFETVGGKPKYTLQRDLTFSSTGIVVAQPNVILDLNGKTVRFSTTDSYGSSGVYAFRYPPAEKWGLDVRRFPEIVALSRANGSGLTVRNGRIAWAGSTTANAQGHYATGVLTTADAGTVTIENVRFDAGSRDGSCVYAAWSNVTIRDSWCENSTASTENRHQIPAAVKAAGKVIAERNVILGGNNALFVGADSVVRYNILRPSGFDTNGYGIHTYKTSGSRFSQNIIVPSMGRGIMFNGGIDAQGKILTTNNQAFDNLIVAREAPNAEFGDNLNATTLRMRYDADNNAFFSNICFAFAGGQYAAASGIYLSNAPSAIGTPRRLNMFYDNVLVSFLVDDPARAQNPFRRYANGITLEKQGLEGNPSWDRISNNRIFTNSYGIRFTGYDGFAYQHIMDNNHITQVDGNAVADMIRAAFHDARFAWTFPSTNTYVTNSSVTPVKQQLAAELVALVNGRPRSWTSRPYYPIHTAYYQGSEAWLIGTRLHSGLPIQPTDIMVENIHEGPTRLVIGHELRLQAMRQNQPLANTVFEVLNNGAIISEVISDARGIVTAPIPDYDLNRTRGASTFQRTERAASSMRIKGASAVATLPSQPSSGTAVVVVFSN